MQSRELTCIVCPMGCRVRVDFEGDGLAVSGNQCARGEKYCRQEVTRPVRVVTSLAAVSGARLPLCPVKTSVAVPKHRVEDVLREIRALRVAAPIQIGDVLIEDVAGTGADVVATANR